MKRPKGARARVKDATIENVENREGISPDYRLIAEAAQDSIYIVDRELNVLYVNAFGASQLGGSPQMITGQNLSQLFPPEALDHQVFNLNKVFNSGRPVLVDDHTSLENQDVWLSTRLIPLKDKEGTVTAIIGFSRDITERRVSEDALKKSEAILKQQLKYSSAINDMADVLIETEDANMMLGAMVEIVGEALGVDRALIYKIDFEDNTVHGLTEWLNPETPGVSSTKKTYSLDMFLRGAMYMWKQKKALISHYNQVNPELVQDGSSEVLHGDMHVKSLLWYPFGFGKKSFYALVFNQISGRRDWDETELHFVRSVAEQVAVAINKLSLVKARAKADKDLQASTERLRNILDETVAALATTAEKKDPFTAGHTQRVVELALEIGKEMKLSEDKLGGVRIAAMVHDIGKLYVPAEILSKPSVLSELEFGIVQAHSEYGFDILKTINFPWPVAKAVIQHHERMDGSGYPAGLKADDICIEAKILAVADVVESMCSHRPYRPKPGVKKALAELTDNRGKLYDPDVVDACVRVFGDRGFKFV